MISDGIFRGAFGKISVCNKVIKKHLNFTKIWLINCLVYFSSFLIIIFINIFSIYIHCTKIPRCSVGIFIISCTINWCFRMNSSLCIKIFSINTGFLINFFIINRFLNFVVGFIFGFILSWRLPIAFPSWLSVLAQASYSSSITRRTAYLRFFTGQDLAATIMIFV